MCNNLLNLLAMLASERVQNILHLSISYIILFIFIIKGKTKQKMRMSYLYFILLMRRVDCIYKLLSFIVILIEHEPKFYNFIVFD